MLNAACVHCSLQTVNSTFMNVQNCRKSLSRVEQINVSTVSQVACEDKRLKTPEGKKRRASLLVISSNTNSGENCQRRH